MPTTNRHFASKPNAGQNVYWIMERVEGGSTRIYTIVIIVHLIKNSYQVCVSESFKWNMSLESSLVKCLEILPMNLADFPFSGRHALNFSLLLDKDKFLPIRWKKFIYKSYSSKKKSLRCINSNILKNVLLFLKNLRK